jgi:glycine cleavage system T protein (aminomethyltransferase)
MSHLKRTPLFAAHQRLGARFVDFGGWEMPLQYSSIVDEHLAVRRAAGIFDISHMGEVEVTGPGSGEFLNHLLTNNVLKLWVGQAQYTLMCQESGGVIDDLYLYRLEDQKFLLILNASRMESDWEWLQAQYDQSQVEGGIQLNRVDDGLGAVAIQGPRVPELVDRVVESGSLGGRLVGQASELRKNEVGIFVFNGITICAARTGYTGEDGFEIVAPSETIEAVWDKVITLGQAYGLQPCGLGARDTLRTEVCYPLYGHELTDEITPLEAGLGFFVDLGKGDFVGRQVLAQQKSAGVRKKCVAFKMSEMSPPPRPHYPIWTAGPDAAKIGEVSSGTQSPSLGIGIGMGFVPVSTAKPGTRIEIEIRGRRAPAEIVGKPIFKKP